MENKKLILPIKCSTLKSVNSAVETTIGVELVIYCIVSVVWMILAVTGVITFDKNWSMDLLAFMGSMFGCAGMGLLLYMWWDDHGRNWYNTNIPALECIKDDEDANKP